MRHFITFRVKSVYFPVTFNCFFIPDHAKPIFVHLFISFIFSGNRLLWFDCLPDTLRPDSASKKFNLSLYGLAWEIRETTTFSISWFQEFPDIGIARGNHALRSQRVSLGYCKIWFISWTICLVEAWAYFQWGQGIDANNIECQRQPHHSSPKQSRGEDNAWETSYGRSERDTALFRNDDASTCQLEYIFTHLWRLKIAWQLSVMAQLPPTIYRSRNR